MNSQIALINELPKVSDGVQHSSRLAGIKGLNNT